MIKKIVIAGCRDYTNYAQAKEYIDFCISKIKEQYELVFISGGCRGADMIGERYAKENGYDYAKELNKPIIIKCKSSLLKKDCFFLILLYSLNL